MDPSVLDTKIEFLKGVGPKRAELLRSELGISTFRDLMMHFPFRYVDRTVIHPIRDISGDAAYVQLKGRIVSAEIVGQKRGRRLVATLEDSTGRIDLVWFQGIKWVTEKLSAGNEYIVFGKPSMFNGKWNIPHPELETPDFLNEGPALHLMPVYNSTEKLKTRGLDSRGIARLMRVLMPQARPHIQEILPPYILDKFRLVPREFALHHIHFPGDTKQLRAVRSRLKFDELLFLQLRILRIRQQRQQANRGYVFSTVGEQFNTFYHEHLPFPLTTAQKRVIKDIRRDMGSGLQMNRLLQGDVGSGKTIVALLCMLIAIDNGFQATLMAPTEILAQQHLKSITSLLGGMDIRVSLLTGSVKGAERQDILTRAREGSIDILIGTHAIIEEAVGLKRLGLAVIDEQHRFGVEQRARMWQKSTHLPHILVMTATPIPRTLAMTVYGDLDVSVIDELPPGRKPVRTILMYDSQRMRLHGFLRQEIAKGRQVYIVYPLIEESEKLDLKDLSDGFETLSREFPLPQYAVSMVHGRLKSSEKDFEMQRFVSGETDIMVSTTVIEVGVDVSNASIMVIENAERFGLSQLHQLRGRVGRGAEQSWCVLMAGDKVSKEARVRLDAMVSTTDGFQIAETDLRLRGPGDIEGTRQSGLLELKIADLVQDEAILRSARSLAQNILAEDPGLSETRHHRLSAHLKELLRYDQDWSQIS